MRRVRLIWFAAGAACASLAAVCAEFAMRSPAEEQGWFLVVEEKGQSVRDGPAFALWRGAEIARDCGARSFEMIPDSSSSDGADRTRIPLVRDNNRATECILRRATDEGLWFDVGLEPMRVAN
jgi:hypothetical protein